LRDSGALKGRLSRDKKKKARRAQGEREKQDATANLRIPKEKDGGYSSERKLWAGSAPSIVKRRKGQDWGSQRRDE